jgi:hypothetical protein
MSIARLQRPLNDVRPHACSLHECLSHSCGCRGTEARARCLIAVMVLCCDPLAIA